MKASGNLEVTGTSHFNGTTLPAAAPSANQMLLSDGSGLLLWKPERSTAYVKDLKSAGTDGRGFYGGSWCHRDLNTLEGDTSFLSLASGNQIILNQGTYVRHRLIGWLITLQYFINLPTTLTPL